MASEDAPPMMAHEDVPMEMSHEEVPPALPPKEDHLKPALPPRRPSQEETNAFPSHPQDQGIPPSGSGYAPPPPPRRVDLEQNNSTSLVQYTRDPRKLIAFLVPFPKPNLSKVPVDRLPPRFLIYTPPPPPISKPAEGEKEGKAQKMQRKWEEEIREAKTGNAETMSWKGVKGKAMKGINWGMSQTKSSNLEFLNRIGAGSEEPDAEATEGQGPGSAKKKKSPLEEMVLIYPESMGDDSEKIKEEFINTMLRSKSKAERDAVIATGLLPVTAAIDILATVVWPFGGLLEIDGVWAYASIRGAKTSRDVTKRLSADTSTTDADKNTLHLNFVPSPRLQLLERYLGARCHESNPKMFPSFGVSPTETNVLEAVGWTPSTKEGEQKSLADEQWEISEVKDDLRTVMKKGAKEWEKWCKKFEEEPEKALKK